ncbi:MAG: hypothetical protein Q8N57_03055, partial [bacterium]|nr:hypothetical protein [bacterium]
MPIPQLRKTAPNWRNGHRYPGQKYSNNRQKDKKTKHFIKLALLLAIFLLIFAVIYVFWVSRDLPNPNQLMTREVAQSTKIYDRTGENV